MSTTALDIHWTAAATGKKASTKISYVNPEAESEELKDLAQALNRLTTNTYSEATRIDQINVDTDDQKKDRDLHFGTLIKGQQSEILYNITLDGTANPAIFFYSNNTITLIQTNSQIEIDDTHAKRTFTVPSQNGIMYAGLIESTEFYSTFVNATVE